MIAPHRSIPGGMWHVDSHRTTVKSMMYLTDVLDWRDAAFGMMVHYDHNLLPTDHRYFTTPELRRLLHRNGDGGGKQGFYVAIFAPRAQLPLPDCAPSSPFSRRASRVADAMPLYFSHTRAPTQVEASSYSTATTHIRPRFPRQLAIATRSPLCKPNGIKPLTYS